MWQVYHKHQIKQLLLPKHNQHQHYHDSVHTLISTATSSTTLLTDIYNNYVYNPQRTNGTMNTTVYTNIILYMLQHKHYQTLLLAILTWNTSGSTDNSNTTIVDTSNNNYNHNIYNGTMLAIVDHHYTPNYDVNTIIHAIEQAIQQLYTTFTTTT